MDGKTLLNTDNKNANHANQVFIWLICAKNGKKSDYSENSIIGFFNQLNCQ